MDNFEWTNKWYYENIKSLEESGLLVKGVSDTIKNEAKERKFGFLSMALGTLEANSLENLLTSKGVKQSNVAGWGVMQAGEGTIRAV